MNECIIVLIKFLACVLNGLILYACVKLYDTLNKRAHREQMENQRREREAYEQAVKDDDTFHVEPCDKYNFNLIEKSPDGKILQTTRICQEGTRLFCQKAKADSSKTYTRKHLKKLINRKQKGDWVKSHEFQYLWSRLKLAG